MDKSIPLVLGLIFLIVFPVAVYAVVGLSEGSVEAPASGEDGTDCSLCAKEADRVDDTKDSIEIKSDEIEKQEGGEGGTPRYDIPPGSSGNFLMAKGDSFDFEVDGEIHNLKLEQIIGSSVTIVISSDPIKFTLNVGDVEYVDVNRDGTKDMTVALNRIEKGIAELTITMLEKVEKVVVPSVPEAEPVAVPEPEEKLPAIITADITAGSAPSPLGFSAGYLVAILIALVMIVAGGYWHLLSKKK